MDSTNGNGNWTGALAAWTAAAHRFAIPVVIAMGLLTAAAAWFTARNLGINTSTTDMISAETPFRANAIAFKQAFPQFSDLIVIVIDAPTPEQAERTAAHLEIAIRAKPALFDRVERPGSEPYFRRNGLLFLETEELQALADRLARAEPLLAALAREPNLAGLFEVLTPALQEGSDGAIEDLLAQIARVAVTKGAELSWRELVDLGASRRQILLAKPALNTGSLAPGAEALAEIRDLVAQLEANRTAAVRGGPESVESERVRVRLTGSVALDYEELQSAAIGGKTAGLISLTLVTLLMIVGLRSAALILPAMITLLAGLIWTAAFAAIAVGHLNLISVAFAVLFVGLGIDFSIHYGLRYREALGEPKRDHDALETAASQVGGSLAVSALCAALGFLSFLPTEYRGLAELGVISGGGMAIALFLNLTLLPALLALFPEPTATSGHPADARITARHHKAIVVAAIALCAVGAGVAPHAEFDFNPMNLKDPDAESVIAFNGLAADGRNGIYAIDLLTPDRTLGKAEADRLRTLSEIGDALTVDSLVPNGQSEKLSIIEETAFFLVPALDPETVRGTLEAEERTAVLEKFRMFLTDYAADGTGPQAKVATRLASALEGPAGNADLAAAFEQRVTKHLPAMLSDLRLALSAGPVTVDDLPDHVRSAWIAENGRARVQLRPAQPIAGNADLRRFARAVLAAAPTAVGTPVTITEAGDAVVRAFQQATLYAFVAVCLVLLVLLRSVIDVALVLFPLVLAAIFTGATAVLLGLPFNFANVIVLPLLFGLGVASGIHLVTRARRTVDTVELMRTSTPRAVLFSALTTIASFGSLALSGHRGMTSMGQLLTIAVAYTLVSTLIVLPALLKWIERRTR